MRSRAVQSGADAAAGGGVGAAGEAGLDSGRAVLGWIVRARRGQLGLASALFVSHQVGELMVPVVAGALIDRAIVTSDGGALARWLVVLAVVFAGLSTSWRWADRLLTRASQETGHDLRLRLTARVTSHEGLAESGPVGEAVSIASGDVDTAVAVQTALAATAAAGAAVLTAAVVLLSISWPIGLVAVLGLPPVLLALHVVARPIEDRAAVQRADAGRAAATATDLVTGLRVLKGLHAEREAGDRYRQASRRSLAAALRATSLEAAHGGMTRAVTGAFVALVALVGGRLAAEGDISIGDFVAAVGVTQFIVGPLNRLGWAATLRSAAMASAARVASVVAGAPRVRGGSVAVTAPQGRVTFRAVGLDPNWHFDLDVEPGTLVAVAASAPEDGDVIAALLARRSDPHRGSVELDGVPLDALRLRDLRRAVLVAEHDAVLFGGSVLDNVVAGRAEAGVDVDGGVEVGGVDVDGLDEVMAAVAADEVARALPDGTATVITERGRSLSGGQRQRIALARAVIGDPPVLVLHEPTTAIDAVTEARIAEGLGKLRAGRTTIVVSTSPALLAAADRVVFVEGSAVVAQGLHAELLDTVPAYASLVAR